MYHDLENYVIKGHNASLTRLNDLNIILKRNLIDCKQYVLP